LVFCEVKSLVGLGDPREGYGEKQRRRLVELSEQFLTEYADLLPAVYDVRYDLIIVGEGEDGRLAVKEHVPDAFRP
jgi:Holliday junction resolvase-like predicted endonuclease